MDIKKLFIVTVLVVGLAPSNMRSDHEYCAPCRYAQPTDNDESDWQIISEQEEQAAAAPLVEFVKQHQPRNRCAGLPHYESNPSPVSFHTQSEPCKAYEDTYNPCDASFQQRLLEEEKEEEESKKPYVIIYRVK